MTAIAAVAAALLRDGAIAVLAVPAGSAVPACLATLAGEARVFAHRPFRADLARAGRVHVALSDADRDIPDRCAAVWPGAGVPVLRRERRLDTLYRDRWVGVIAIAGADPLPVLEGAQGVLARQSPAVLLGADVDEAAVGRVLPRHVPRRIGALCCFTADGVLPPQDPDVAEPAITVAFDAALVGAGLHPPEADNPRGGRWTGASVATWFMMPRPAQGTWRLRLDVADWGNAAAGFPLRIDGQAHAPAMLGRITASYGPIRVAPSDQPLCIRLLPPPAERDMRRGPRRIGLRLLRASLYPAG